MIYEGPVKFQSSRKDGTPLVIKSGKNAGTAYRIISFKDESGEWVNLPDWNNTGKDIHDGDIAKVAFQPKVDDFGDPVLYNDRPQYMLDAIKLVASNGSGAASAPSGGGKEPYNAGLGAYQTALNGAVALEAAILGNLPTGEEVAPDLLMRRVLERAEQFHQYLTTGKLKPLEAIAAEAQEVLGGTVEAPIDPDMDDGIPF